MSEYKNVETIEYLKSLKEIDLMNADDVVEKGDFTFIINHQDKDKHICDYIVSVTYNGKTDIHDSQHLVKDPIIIRLADDKKELFPGSYIVSSCLDINQFMPLREYDEDCNPIYSDPYEMIEKEYPKLKIVSNLDNLDVYFDYQY